MKQIYWKRLINEPVTQGDFWASHDPNTPERQGDMGYNLQMQAIHPNNYGKPAKDIPLGNGAHWRPAGFCEITLV